MVNKYIPINTVLSDVVSAIPAEHWNESDAIEWAFKAGRAIKAIEKLSRNIVTLSVSGFKATLPDDYVLLELMAYKLSTDPTSASDLEDIINDIGHDNDTYYAGFNPNNGLFISEYKPLRLSRSPYALSVTCEDSPNIYIPFSETYTINPTGTIITSFEEGTIILVYRRYHKDCDGNYMIPDDEAYVTALKSFVMMRIWEYRMNMKEEGAMQMYKMYKSDWALFAQKAKGSIKMPSIDQLENLRQTRMRLIEKSRDYYKGFDLRREEDLTF